MKNENEKIEIGKIEMNSIVGGVSNLQTEHTAYSGNWFYTTIDVNGDSYPDDCCEE